MFHIALIHPQIPPNTGQIARLCAATGTALHLVRPLGFRLTDRALRRAGLDYWEKVEVHTHDSLEAFLRAVDLKRCRLFTKAGTLRYDQVAYAPGDWLVFGSETDGLPPELTAACPECTVRIPMRAGAVRSLNLASSVSIALYEALRQNGFGFAGPQGT
jgi:tRNA (cytidine/uridine-2'-O-)-methyltransferase